MSAPKPAVVMLSSVEWDAAWQRHQLFAVRWAEAGHDVFFVENTGFREPSWGDLPRLWRKAWRMVFERNPRRHLRPPSNLRVLNPLVLPPTRGLFRRLNALFLVPRLLTQLRDRGLTSAPIVVAYLPTATTLAALEALAPSAVVYDCVDNFHGLPAAPLDLARTESAVLAASDLVVTTSRTLYEEKSRQHPRVLELHQGVGPEFFLDDAPAADYRRLCYFGTLWHAVDYAPVRALAEAGFSVTLIGPQKEPPPPLPASVRFKRALPHDRLPAELAGYDALLLPYVQSDYNRGVTPAKVYECLATGRPVIASALPALEPLADVLHIARAPADWVRIVEALPRTETGAPRRLRLARARANEHSAVFARLKAEIESIRRPKVEPAAARSPLAELLRGFTWIGLFYGLAKASTLITQVIAGRWLGPVEYGKANLVIAAAAYLQILPIMGFPVAMSKFVAEEPDENERSRIVATTLTAFTVWALAWLLALSRFGGAIARRLAIAPELFGAAVTFSFLTAFYIVFSSPLLGLRRYDRRGRAEAIYGLSAPLILVALLSGGNLTHSAMIQALCASLVMGGAYSVWMLRAYLKPSFDARAFGVIFKYAAVATLNLLATASVLAPARLILHRYNSPEQVGIFSAYFTATVQISLALLYMLGSVVVPLASRPDGQRDAWSLFRRWSAPLWLSAWLGFLATAAAAMAVFGRKYPFHPELAALFALTAAVILVHGVASTLFAARDFKGLCVSVAGNLIAGASNIALAWRLIPRWGIAGAGAALLCSYLAGLLFYALADRRSFRIESTQS